MHTPSTDQRATLEKFQGVLDHCRNTVLIFVNSQLSDLFENTDTALIEFAERAENSQMQGHFFEAIATVKDSRPNVEYVFRREINEGFDHFGTDWSKDTNTDPENDAQIPELSLVEPDEMEESVAEENLINKARANFYPELYALRQRLAVVNGGKKLKEAEIPAGPHHLAHAFRCSVESLDIEVKIKLILYALFDKYVLSQAKSLYDEFNGNLKAVGILPNLKAAYIRRQAPAGSAKKRSSPESQQSQDALSADPSAFGDPLAAEAGVPTGSSGLGEELFQSVLQLMASRRTHPTGADPNSPTGYAASAGNAGPVVSASELVNVIDAVQPHAGVELAAPTTVGNLPLPNIEVDARLIERVKETLGEERKRIFLQIKRENLSPVHADVIDLVGMLFEYMLNDPVLPDVAKALLSHLHTPYLKLAVIDRYLLANNSHPARRLLDVLVDAGSQWVDENNPERGILPKIKAVVDRVLKEFTNNVELFEELFEHFQTVVTEQKRKSEVIEQRAQEAVQGRERLQVAKQRATEEIQSRLDQAPVPVPISSFLSKSWYDKLVFIQLRNPKCDQSAEWTQALRIVDDLVAPFNPKTVRQKREALKRQLPELITQIKQGLQALGGHLASTTDELFALLENADAWQPDPPTSESPTRASPAGQSEGPAAEAREQPRVSNTGGTNQQSPSKAGRPDEQGIPEDEQRLMTQLRNIEFGTWFQFRGREGRPNRLVKLSWISTVTTTCMFVDRSGVQAQIKTLRQLAQDMLSGDAKIVQQQKQPFIERAMIAIRKMLQRPRRSPEPKLETTEL